MPVTPRPMSIFHVPVRAPALIAVVAITAAFLAGPGLKTATAETPAPQDPAALATTPVVPDIEFGRMLVMQRCANCHAIAEGEDRYAAPLHHLFGRKAGSIEGYTFSRIIKDLNIPWSPSALDSWLEKTTFDTPDIRMRHTGIEKSDQRDAILAFLKTLPGNQTPKH